MLVWVKLVLVVGGTGAGVCETSVVVDRGVDVRSVCVSVLSWYQCEIVLLWKG